METLKCEFNKMMRQDMFEDEIWGIKSDALQNYNAYFSDYNSFNIINNQDFIEILRTDKTNKTQSKIMFNMLKSMPSNKKRSRKVTSRSLRGERTDKTLKA